MQLTARATTVMIAAVLLAVGAVPASSGLAAPSEPGNGPSGGPTLSRPPSGGPTCTTDMPRLRYVVLFDSGTDRSTAEALIAAACGGTTVYYPEIAVAVASSAVRSFADRIGRDRAYSAQAEALTGRERPARGRSPRGDRGLLAPQAGAARDAVAGDRTGEQWNMAMIRADAARAVTAGSADVLVGVLDSGIDADHPELSAAIDAEDSAGCTTGKPDTSAASWRPTGQHGTHVAGLIAAANDGVGITGVAPGVRIAAVKVVDSAGFIYPEYAVCGFMWAAKRGMRVTNNSYFVDPWLFTCRDEPGQAVANEAVHRAAAYATASGVLSVAAIGNDSVDLAAPTVDAKSPNNARNVQRRPVDDQCDVLPAELPDVLTVAAVGAKGVKSSYSSYGADVVDLAAPGGDLRQRAPGLTSGCVLSTVPGGYGRMCGTSMASPHVAGVAALVASRHPQAGPAELAEVVRDSARPVECPDSYDPNSDGRQDATCAAGRTTSFYGNGMLDALAAAER